MHVNTEYLIPIINEDRAIFLIKATMIRFETAEGSSPIAIALALCAAPKD
jgi:hypothetical protein